MSFLILTTTWGARLVLVVLLGLSVWSVRIIIDRKRALLQLGDAKERDEAEGLIRRGDWKGLALMVKDRNSLLCGALKAALEVNREKTEQVDRAVRSYLTTQRRSLEQGLTVLATLGSNAPFIGLFGTVLGIIQAFGVLATSPSGSASVMGALAEALVATAVGLLVAIPAGVAFNYFSRSIKTVMSDCEAMRDLYLSRAETKGL